MPLAAALEEVRESKRKANLYLQYRPAYVFPNSWALYLTTANPPQALSYAGKGCEDRQEQISMRTAPFKPKYPKAGPKIGLLSRVLLQQPMYSSILQRSEDSHTHRSARNCPQPLCLNRCSSSPVHLVSGVAELHQFLKPKVKLRERQ